VLMTHSFVLSTGREDSEPLRIALGLTWGSIAVHVFFIASGFLVTGSLLYRQRMKDFLVARALRILPALWVSLVVTVSIVGTFFTNLTLPAFISDGNTWKFLANNAILITGVAWNLPGAFVGNPVKGTVNGSLWTLPPEIYMYCVLAGLWLVASLLRINKIRWISIACITLATFCVVLAIVGVSLRVQFFRNSSLDSLIYFGAMFFSGAAMRVLQNRIIISHALAFALIAALLTSAALDRTGFNVLYRLALPYLVLYLAMVPSGNIRRFNALGDYSYGMYIYAFPVQQSLAALWRGINPSEMMTTSFVITLTLAVGSWHLLEKPALSLKGRFI